VVADDNINGEEEEIEEVDVDEAKWDQSWVWGAWGREWTSWRIPFHHRLISFFSLKFYSTCVIFRKLLVKSFILNL
jgi:hypothetical protein